MDHTTTFVPVSALGRVGQWLLHEAAAAPPKWQAARQEDRVAASEIRDSLVKGMNYHPIPDARRDRENTIGRVVGPALSKAARLRGTMQETQARSQPGIPTEVGVAEDVHVGLQGGEARRQRVTAHRLGQVGVPQQPLLRQQLLLECASNTCTQQWPAQRR